MLLPVVSFSHHTRRDKWGMVAGGRVVGGRGYCQGTALLRTVSLGRLLPKARKDDAKREGALLPMYNFPHSL